MDKILKGKVALVTGASRGIGAACALALADAGADVAITYATSAATAAEVVARINDKGVSGIAYQYDQADTKAVTAIVEKVAQQFGKLDILINNAGTVVIGLIDDPNTDMAACDNVFAVNALGVIAAIRAAAKVMAPGGRIISIGSMTAVSAGMRGVAHYSGSKTAIIGYSKGAARDLGPRNITVNVINPGSIDTDMNPADGPRADAGKAATCLGRFGRPDEIAAGVVFFASPGASYITGAVLNIDGGLYA